VYLGAGLSEHMVEWIDHAHTQPIQVRSNFPDEEKYGPYDIDLGL
jgi:hypothetical protein